MKQPDALGPVWANSRHRESEPNFRKGESDAYSPGLPEAIARRLVSIGMAERYSVIGTIWLFGIDRVRTQCGPSRAGRT